MATSVAVAARRGVTLEAGDVDAETAAETSRGRNVPRNIPAFAGSTRTCAAAADVLSELFSSFKSPFDELGGPDAVAEAIPPGLTRSNC